MFPKKIRVQDKELLKSIRAQPCCICVRQAVDACHIRSRGAGGPDAAFNLIPMCRMHHAQQHQIGFIKMILLYPPLRFRLSKMGWQWSEDNLWHPDLIS